MAVAKEVQWELQEVEDFEDIVVVRAAYILATKDKRQHWHSIVP